MADYTENYNLKKPDRTDFYNIQDFNDNADIIDTALDDKLNKDFSNVSSGAVPIANGGTGATTAANALSNLGALPLSGGTLTGDIRLKPTNSNYGSKINFGDGDYAYIKENTDDNLEIKAKNINFAVTSGYDKLTVSTNADPTSSQKKALFTSAGNINTDLIKNYGLLGDNGWVRNQNVLTYIDSIEAPHCGIFGTEGCTNTPNDNWDYWFMTLLINNGQKTLLANICSNTNNLTCETWINQRWYINGSDTWCGWQKIPKYGERGEFMALELSTTTPFIDFHYNSSTEDYTARIIQTGLNVLQFSNTYPYANGTLDVQVNGKTVSTTANSSTSGATYVTSSTPSYARNNDLWAW